MVSTKKTVKMEAAPHGGRITIGALEAFCAEARAAGVDGMLSPKARVTFTGLLRSLEVSVEDTAPDVSIVRDFPR